MSKTLSSVTSVSLNCLAVNTDKPIGVERFVRNVVSGIQLENIRVSCYARTAVRKLDQLVGPEFTKSNTRVNLKRIPVGSTTSRILVEMLVLPFFTFTDDVVLSINNFGPLWGKPTQSRILIIHDIWFMSPDYEGGLLRKWAFKFLLGMQIKLSTKIITVSDFSMREINRFFKVPLSRIHIIKNCIARNIEACSILNDNCELLLIGSDRKNKNIFRAVEGFCKYKKSNPHSTAKLIVVGKYSDSYVRKIKLSFSEHLTHIDFAGYVDEARLEYLYQRCHGVLFPSLYEGFGMPAVEGLLFGKPVLVSRDTACAEILGNFAVTVDATDTACISQGISKVLETQIDVLSPNFRAFQQKYMHCRDQSKALTSILLDDG